VNFALLWTMGEELITPAQRKRAATNAAQKRSSAVTNATRALDELGRGVAILKKRIKTAMQESNCKDLQAQLEAKQEELAIAERELELVSEAQVQSAQDAAQHEDWRLDAAADAGPSKPNKKGSALPAAATAKANSAAKNPQQFEYAFLLDTFGLRTVNEVSHTGKLGAVSFSHLDAGFAGALAANAAAPAPFTAALMAFGLLLVCGRFRRSCLVPA